MARLLNYPDIHAEALHQNNEVQPLKIVTMNKRPHPLPRQSLRPIAALLPLAFCSLAISAEKGRRPPNIIVIFSDDHAWQASRGVAAVGFENGRAALDIGSGTYEFAFAATPPAR